MSVTRDEIESLGWTESNILLSGNDEDQLILESEDDAFLISYTLTIENEQWYCLYSNRDIWSIRKRWYRDKRAEPSWREVYYGSIPDKSALKQLMEWLEINNSNE